MKSATAIIAALLTLTSASPIQSRAITSAEFSNFAVSCNGSTCSYSTKLTLLPENAAISCTHSTSGAKVPVNSGFWTCSDPNVWLRFNKVPPPVSAYRVVLTDARVAGEPVTVDYFSPVADWPGDGGYTGPTGFTAS